MRKQWPEKMGNRHRIWLHELAHAVVALRVGWKVPSVEVDRNRGGYYGQCHLHPKPTPTDFLFNRDLGIVQAAPYYLATATSEPTEYEKWERRTVSHLNPDDHYLAVALQSKEVCNLLYKATKRHWRKVTLPEPQECPLIREAVKLL